MNPEMSSRMRFANANEIFHSANEPAHTALTSTNEQNEPNEVGEWPPAAGPETGVCGKAG
jgi:hypothetical protein